MSVWVPTVSAVADLQDIHSYGEANWGQRRARNYIAELYELFDELGQRPGLGVLRAELGEAMRSFPKGSHITFYRARGDRIIVARVVHGSMDHARLFDEYDPMADLPA